MARIKEAATRVGPFKQGSYLVSPKHVPRYNLECSCCMVGTNNKVISCSGQDIRIKALNVTVRGILSHLPIIFPRYTYHEHVDHVCFVTKCHCTSYITELHV